MASNHNSQPFSEEYLALHDPFGSVKFAQDALARDTANLDPSKHPRTIPSSEIIPGRRARSHGPIKITSIDGVPTALGIKLEQERLAKLAAAEAAKEGEVEQEAVAGSVEGGKETVAGSTEQRREEAVEQPSS